MKQDKTLSFQDVQDKIGKAFELRDAKISKHHIMTILTEEVGELASALNENDMEDIENEITDVVLVALSMACKFKLNIYKNLMECIKEQESENRVL